jgi:Tfp pilus assembly protein PilO
MNAAQSVAFQAQNITALRAENDALRSRLGDYEQQLQTLKTQLEWFKRQLFGQRSEKRFLIDPAIQADVLAGLGADLPAPRPAVSQEIRYERRKPRDRNG